MCGCWRAGDELEPMVPPPPSFLSFFLPPAPPCLHPLLPANRMPTLAPSKEAGDAGSAKTDKIYDPPIPMGKANGKQIKRNTHEEIKDGETRTD